jgi:hypothetical protein
LGNVAAIQFWLVGEIAVSAWCIRWKSAMFDVAVKYFFFLISDVAVKYFAVVVCFLVYCVCDALIRVEVVGSCCLLLVYWFYAVLIRAEVVGSY